MRTFFQRFLAALALLSVAVSAGAGIFIHFFASGSDMAMLHRSFLAGYSKWHFSDIHTVFGLFALLTGSLWLVLRMLPKAEQRPRWLRDLSAVILATLIVVYGGYRVLNGHPVLVEPPRLTDFVATAQPDMVVLTVRGDPATSISVQWRTSLQQETGAVRYRALGDSEWSVVRAEGAGLDDPYLINDPYVLRHTARLEGLSPATRYEYEIGHGASWTSARQFMTAPEEEAGFQFIYMGDAQNGLEAWGELLHASARRHPEVLFYALAGDLVEDGDYRDQWDVFLDAAGGVLDRVPLLPAVGNHDTSSWVGPATYRATFDLPRNGPEALTPERAYFVDYSLMRFIVLDSEAPIEAQTEWLERTLAGNKRPWTLVMYHHPMFTSAPDRDNPELRKHWMPLFDEYGVDLALQGNDHAYLRTEPMRAGVAARDAQDGTTYVIAIAGTKYYSQEAPSFAARAFTELSTYQVIDVQPTRLSYTAYTLDGTIVDAFHIDKDR